MDYRIVWTREGTRCLNREFRWIARDRPQAALSFRQRVLDAVALLGRSPQMGSPYEADRTKQWREIFVDSYRIFYRTSNLDAAVYVASIRHASRDEPTRADLLG